MTGLRPSGWAGLSILAIAGCSTGYSETVAVSEVVVQGSIGLETALSLGSLSDDETTFGMIQDVAIGPEEQVYVADGMMRAVSVFSPDGRFLGRYLGRGEGPGEAGSISDITVGDQGDLWVYDASLRRVTQLSSDGALRATHPVRPGFHEPNVLAVSTEGRVFGRFLATRDAMLPTGRRSEWFDLTSMESRAPAPPRDPVGPAFSLVTPEGERMNPFSIEYLSDLGPDGCLYSIRSDAYEVTRDCNGRTEVVISRPDEAPIEVPDGERAEWEAVSDFLTEFSVRMGDGDPHYPAIPRIKPFVRQLVVDTDGRIWLQRYTDPVPYPYAPGEAEEKAEAGRSVLHNRSENRWDVFTPDGEPLGDVVLPLRARFFDARGDLVAGVAQGVDAIPRAVLWRMRLHRPDLIAAVPTVVSDGM